MQVASLLMMPAPVQWERKAELPRAGTGPQTFLRLGVIDTERDRTTVAPSHTLWGLSSTPLWDSSTLPMTPQSDSKHSTSWKFLGQVLSPAQYPLTKGSNLNDRHKVCIRPLRTWVVGGGGQGREQSGQMGGYLQSQLLLLPGRFYSSPWWPGGTQHAAQGYI